MIRFNQILKLAVVAAAFSVVSCTEETADYVPAQPTSAECPGLSFVTNKNVISTELDPNDPTRLDVTLMRNKGMEAASYKLNVLTNTESVFVAPSEIAFAAGDTTATFTVTFDKAEVGKTYNLQIALEDGDIDPYKATTRKTFSAQIVRVKWNSLGMGQWIDDFWYGFWDEIEIFQRDDKPQMYRVKSPYTNEFVDAMENNKGTYKEYFVFTVSNDIITWENDRLYINTSYQTTGIDIVGFRPSLVTGSTADDEACKVVKDEKGNILYFQLAPYWYVSGLGGFGIYNLYLAFPGVDLAGAMGL